MERMFWVDLEMSGLDEKVHRILEVAVVITDLEFKELETYHAVVQQPPEVLKAMDEWCTRTHGKSGLTAAVANGKAESQVEDDLVALVGRHFSEKDRVVLCGNSVGNDKRFLDAYMPKLAKRLHYRIVDVSSFKEIFKSKWKVEFKKSENHRALEDARASIAEIKTYLALVTPPAPKTTESTPST